MESQACEGHIEDIEACYSSEEISDESEEEGEFEVVHSTSIKSKRLPKFKLRGTFNVGSAGGDVRALATKPKETDEIYLKTQNNNAILIMSLQGETKMTLDNKEVTVEDIAVDENGHVVVVNSVSRDIYVYDREGNAFNSFTVSPRDDKGIAVEETGLEITSVDIDRNKKIAIGCCLSGKGAVMIYEMDGEFKRCIDFNIKPVFISSRYFLIAVSDPKRRAVEVRHNDKTGELVRTLQLADLGPRIEPCGILLTWDHLFVVTKTTNQNKPKAITCNKGAVQLYDTNSMAYLCTAISGLENPRGIDVTHDGTLVIADGCEIKLFNN